MRVSVATGAVKGVMAVWFRRREGITQAPAPDAPAIPLCSPGSEVTVFADDPGGGGGTMFHARIALVDDDQLLLARAAEIRLHDDALVTLRWCVASGERCVTASVESITGSTWAVRAVGEVIHQQRRAWVRVETAVAVRVRGVDDESWQTGETVNLSAGGMAAVFGTPLNEAPAVGAELDIEIGLPAGTITVAGTVLQAQQSQPGHDLRTAFAAMPEGTRGRLAGYVFQVQREKLARERLQR